GLLTSNVEVSIRSRPEGREERPGLRDDGRRDRVSIRSRPEGREEQAMSGQSLRVPGQFQSAPDPKVGRNKYRAERIARTETFQSAPDPKVGRNAGGRARQEQAPPVSIRSRP